jgi:hypothetical protein
MKRAPVLLTVGIILLTTIGFASTARADEVEQLIKSAHLLEEKPLDKEAREARSWAIEWLSATDKVTVTLCSLLVSNVDKKYKYGPELFGQYTIGMGAFKLEFPDKASDEDAAQLAGIESALKSYEAIVAAQPKDKNDFMDQLLARRGDGTLAGYVKENNCKKTN